ncbi:MAG: sugar ABC transporter permease [Clostridiales bacterium]|jgi:raffinose/stachyose/melibiose transport system permease protein|nr:sugar ABC transporter permease [Clostridiales bacterium]MDR2749800.1 sugar ABC transporter permease [Clostridiales bacterium]
MKRLTSPSWYALFTAPLLSVFALVVLVPFFMGIGYSFVTWDGLPLNPMEFAGFGNYAALFSDGRFLDSAKHTMLFTALAIALINALALAFALVATSKLKTRNIARTMLFMPYLIGGLILGYIWKFILGDAFKAIGEATGLTSIFFNWLLDPTFALLATVAVTTWQMAGYIMIIYITGIQSIPEEVLEAAQVDGAGFWRTLFQIKFPLIMQSFTICLFLTLSNCFKIFDVNLSLTAGGPYLATEMFAMNIYNEIFSLSNFGYGQAKAVFFFIIVAGFTLAQVAATKKREVEA